MAFDITTVLQNTVTFTSQPNNHGIYSLSLTLENQDIAGDYLFDAIKAYASENNISLKEDIRNSYLKVYLKHSYASGELTKDDLDTADYTAQVALKDLHQAQEGSEKYEPITISGLPANARFKCAFELVLNGELQGEFLLAPSSEMQLGGSNVAEPENVVLSITETAKSVEVKVSNVSAEDNTHFLLEVVDDTKRAMPEVPYEQSVVFSGEFEFQADSEPTFMFTVGENNMRSYVNYSVHLRTIEKVDNAPNSASASVKVDAQSFELPWLAGFVDTTVIKGKQIEDALVSKIATKLTANKDARKALRTALNSGAYSLVASQMYDLTRDVAVEEFESAKDTFNEVRTKLRRIALYSDIDPDYSEVLDLSGSTGDAEFDTYDVFMFVTKQGFTNGIETRYFTWLGKAFYLGPIVEGGVISDKKFQVSVRGDVYRDRAELIFS
ncbi:hypothetical protein [Pseudoalteromonas sp. PS5]|uniref:hypothetical protein n=1 Tax=Pseudoalteromonas sp. PS5 TaxID=1437473 RepID=UPI000FFE60B6|nr:hypothetical protein [Pseudoalteromonas sp. PS5]RXF04068.1 hypothetical protein D9603_06745 [Pseudoalteromonas sp. PS5]